MKTLTQAEQEARTIVNNWATGALITGWIPGSTLFLTGADLVMIRQVAIAFEIPTFDESSALTTISGTVASGIVGSLITEGVGLIPVAGWIVKSGLMAGKAKLLGDSVVDYFKTRSPLTDEATV